MTDLRFSIVLCTRDRSNLLADALESIGQLDYPASDFELVVVNNGSTDDTAAVVDAFAADAPFTVRCVDEPRKGLSNARNRGIAEAAGHWLFFTDDDQLVDRQVLREHERVATHHGARAQQGGIAPTFPTGRPPWLRDRLTVILGETDPRPEGPAVMDLFGGNMVFRRDLFDEMAGFDAALGKGAVGYSEDIEISKRLEQMGEPIVYAPSALVYHVIGSDRADQRFFRRVSYDKGYSDGVRLRGQQRGLSVSGRAALGVLGSAGQVAWGLLRRDAYWLVLAQTRVANQLGRVAGYFSGR